jgi:hypothetical protein
LGQRCAFPTTDASVAFEADSRRLSSRGNGLGMAHFGHRAIAIPDLVVTVGTRLPQSPESLQDDVSFRYLRSSFLEAASTPMRVPLPVTQDLGPTAWPSMPPSKER